MAPITVHDVLRLALPPGTTVAAGANGLLRQVTWVVTPRATLPAFANLRGGELALVSVAAVRELDDRLPLLSLPDGADVREVEREVQRLISDFEAQVERRAAQLSTLLNQRSLAGAGLQGLLETLSERTG